MLPHTLAERSLESNARAVESPLCLFLFGVSLLLLVLLHGQNDTESTCCTSAEPMLASRRGDTGRCGGLGTQEYSSKEYSFVAAPEAGMQETVKILAVADMGQAEVDGSNEWWQQIGSLGTLRYLLQDAPSHQLLIHNGDISYAW